MDHAAKALLTRLALLPMTSCPVCTIRYCRLTRYPRHLARSYQCRQIGVTEGNRLRHAQSHVDARPCSCMRSPDKLKIDSVRARGSRGRFHLSARQSLKSTRLAAQRIEGAVRGDLRLPRVRVCSGVRGKLFLRRRFQHLRNARHYHLPAPHRGSTKKGFT